MKVSARRRRNWTTGRPDRSLAVGLALVAYTHVGYPLVIGLAARRRRRLQVASPPAQSVPVELPTMTVVIAALDEEQVISQKIADVLAQDYPDDRLAVLVVADGSTDATAEIASRAGVAVLHDADASGKSAAVNRGVAAARSELVCLTDANCALAPGALRALAAAFADPGVAVVSGAKTVVGAGALGGGEGLYWRLESLVKAAESAFGAVMGAPGEICGLRRSTVRRIPPGVINDDYHLTCDALVRGFRVGYAPDARAVEEVSTGVADELERRTRVAAGTWQTTLGHLRLADPRGGWLALAFWSHRILRSLVVPALLPVLLVGSAAAARRSRLAGVLAIGQGTAYALALLGLRTDNRVMAVPFQFALTNAAALRGGLRHLSGRQPVVWRRVDRGGWVAAREAA